MITLAHASSITSEKVAGLRPAFRSRVEAWLADCDKAGLRIYVYCGVRTCREQEALFARGRHVTRARGGQSYHNYGRAIDFVPLLPNTKNAGMYDAGWDAAKIYDQAQKLAASHRLKALSWETPHLQDADFASFRELPAAEKIP